MDGNRDPWTGRIGLVSIATLTGIGLCGGLILANNGHEVPPWLSASIGSLVSTLGIITLAIYGRGGNGGNGGSSKAP